MEMGKISLRLKRMRKHSIFCLYIIGQAHYELQFLNNTIQVIVNISKDVYVLYIPGKVKAYFSMVTTTEKLRIYVLWFNIFMGRNVR
jgi:hypothetical protein